MPRAERSPGAAHRGFTLVEVVVALAVFALGASVIYQSLGWSLRRNSVLIQEELAWMTAQSVLADLRSREQQLPSAAAQGRTDAGMRWEARVERIAFDAPAGSLVPYNVDITVRWGERSGQYVQLRTVELVRPIG